MSLRDILPGMVLPFTRIWSYLNPGARILMYHRVADLGNYDQLTVGVERFYKQMAWIHENKQVCSLEEIVESISNHTIKSNQVAITFDDGYLDNLEHALPILEEFNLPATLYVTSDFASQKSSHPRYKNQTKRLHLNWQEIHTLSKHPLITIGSHTVSHPMLSELSDEESNIEISTSKKIIESSTSANISHFCYPSGNYAYREKNIIARCGYSSAVTVKPGRNTHKSDVFALCRTEVTDRDNIKLLQQKLDGAFDIFHYLLDIKRELKFSRDRNIKLQEYNTGK